MSTILLRLHMRSIRTRTIREGIAKRSRVLFLIAPCSFPNAPSGHSPAQIVWVATGKTGQPGRIGALRSPSLIPLGGPTVIGHARRLVALRPHLSMGLPLSRRLNQDKQSFDKGTNVRVGSRTTDVAVSSGLLQTRVTNVLSYLATPLS